MNARGSIYLLLLLVTSQLIMVTCENQTATSAPAWDREDCRLQKDPGPCKGMFPRFYFHTDTLDCREFIYGGCQGNKNNFETKETCQKLCMS